MSLLRGNTLEAFQRGLESVGVKMEGLTTHELDAMLTHALGYVDFTKESIIKECLDYAEVKYDDDEQ